MKKSLLILLLMGLIAMPANSQVGIGTVTPNPDAMLEVASTNRGFLFPRLALSAVNDPSPMDAHIAGMTVYNTATSGSGALAVKPGFYVNNGSEWIRTGNDARSEARWVNKPGKIVLLNLSDGATLRPTGTEFVALDNGNIGIGTATPDNKVTVAVTSSSRGIVLTGPTALDKSFTFDTIGPSGQGEINWRKPGASKPISAAIKSMGGDTYDNKGLGFFTGSNNNTTTDAILQLWISEKGMIRMPRNGSTAYNPSSKFGIEVNQGLVGLNTEGIKINQSSGNLLSMIYPDDFTIQVSGSGETLRVSSDAGSLFLNSKSGAGGGIKFNTGNVTRFEIIGDGSSTGYGGIAIYDENSNVTAKFTPEGKVGIGNTNPQEKVVVNGAAKIGSGTYTGITDGATTPVPAGGPGTIVYLANSFYGYTGSANGWKKLDNP